MNDLNSASLSHPVSATEDVGNNQTSTATSTDDLIRWGAIGDGNRGVRACSARIFECIKSILDARRPLDPNGRPLADFQQDDFYIILSEAFIHPAEIFCVENDVVSSLPSTLSASAFAQHTQCRATSSTSTLVDPSSVDAIKPRNIFDELVHVQDTQFMHLSPQYRKYGLLALNRNAEGNNYAAVDVGSTSDLLVIARGVVGVDANPSRSKPLYYSGHL